MIKTCVGIILAIGAAHAHAQTVELRVVERQGRTTVTGPADAQLNFAVQGRVVGGSPTLMLGQVGFTVHLVGERDSNGVFARGLISNPDHTYTSDIGVSSVVGRGGLASQYSYLAALNPGFNGKFNASSGTFVNGPDQEIFIITGDGLGGALLGTPGIDSDQDGNPDSWTGNGAGAPPPQGATASVDPTIAATYFGAGGQWIDIYRFRYTITNFPARSFNAHLESVFVGTASDIFCNAGLWGLPAVPATAAAPGDWSILVADPDTGSCCDLASGACSIAPAADCAGAFLDTAGCTPTPCPPVGKCCDTTGACFFVIQGFCDNTWTATGTCDPNPCPQPGSCCDRYAVCLLRLRTLCIEIWTAGATCSPNACPPVGHCCANEGGCSLVPQPWCGAASTWGPDATCSPSPCAPVSCCDNATVACQMSSTGGCPPGSSLGGAGMTCSPSPCVTVACCNQTSRGCTLAGAIGGCPGGTVGQEPNTTCSPNLCPGVVCCDPTSGGCLVAAQSCSSGWMPVGAGTACSATSCPLMVCCNQQTGVCTVVGVAGNCPAGAIGHASNTPCVPSTCPPGGRCCAADGSCTLTLAANCLGDWSESSDCFPLACPLLGACCEAGECTMQPISGCGVDMFRGVGTVCGLSSNRLDCCPANFNRVNGVDINDLLDFSAAWFGHEAAADFDHDGALTVSDYMQFLTAWIAGCQ